MGFIFKFDIVILLSLFLPFHAARMHTNLHLEQRINAIDSIYMKWEHVHLVTCILTVFLGIYVGIFNIFFENISRMKKTNKDIRSGLRKKILGFARSIEVLNV